MNQTQMNSSNLSFACIDYPKTFDSVPHLQLVDILSIYKSDNRIITIKVEDKMPLWD